MSPSQFSVLLCFNKQLLFWFISLQQEKFTIHQSLKEQKLPSETLTGKSHHNQGQGLATQIYTHNRMKTNIEWLWWRDCGRAFSVNILYTVTLCKTKSNENFYIKFQFLACLGQETCQQYYKWQPVAHMGSLIHDLPQNVLHIMTGVLKKKEICIFSSLTRIPKMSPRMDTNMPNVLVKVSMHKIKHTTSPSNQQFTARAADSNTQHSKSTVKLIIPMTT